MVSAAATYMNKCILVVPIKVIQRFPNRLKDVSNFNWRIFDFFHQMLKLQTYPFFAASIYTAILI